MNGNCFIEIINGLNSIEKDESLPRNVKIKIKSAIESLNNETIELNLRVDRSLEELGSLAEDPTTPSHARAQILSFVSLLESRE